MPEPTLKDAVDACQYVRDLIKKKSNNKFREEWTLDRKKTFNEVDGLISAWASEVNLPDPEKQPIKYIEAVAKWAGEKQAGNCMQYACAAFVFLKEKGVFPIEVVGLLRSMLVGHNFLLAGRPKEAPTTIMALEKSKWADTIFIVDGWAHIACSVKEYRQKWKQQLEKWVGKNKTTPNPFTNEPTPFKKGSGWPELFDEEKGSELTFVGRLEK